MLRRIAYSLTLVLLLLPAAAAAQAERPTSTLDGAVTFKLPESWEVGPYVTTPGRGVVQATIPYPAAERANLKAEVTLTARPVPPGVTVAQESDGVAKNRYEGLAVLSDTADGDHWRTLVWTFRAGGRAYLVLHRFGVEAGRAVELRAALPLFAGGDPKWVERAASDFNALCESLKIDGRNRFEHRITPDKFAGHVKVTNR
ncbi:MAG TPA: hypothetical protein VF668_05985 [Pyrinomonadaceae bacterium]|jgi:hypothetical protein